MGVMGDWQVYPYGGKNWNWCMICGQSPCICRNDWSVCSICRTSPCTCWKPTTATWPTQCACVPVDYEKIREIVKEELKVIHNPETKYTHMITDYFNEIMEKAKNYDKLCEHFRESDLMDLPTEEEDE